MALICEHCGEKITSKHKRVFDEVLKELIEQELTVKEIAHKLGVGTSVIYRHLDKLKVKKIFKLPKGDTE